MKKVTLGWFKYVHNGHGFTISFQKSNRRICLIDFYRFSSHWYFHILGKGLEFHNIKKGNINLVSKNVKILNWRIRLSKDLTVK